MGKGSRSYWDCEGRHKCEGSEAMEAVQAVVVDANLTAAAAKCIPNDTCSGWCNFVMGKIYGKLASETCAEIILEGDSLCELVGLGPDDPLSDICATVVTTGCPIAAKELAKGIQSPGAVCESLGHSDTCCSGHSYTSVHHCGLLKRCGCLGAGQCVSETGSVADCCSGTGSRSWDCEGRHKCEGSESSEVVVV